MRPWLEIDPVDTDDPVEHRFCERIVAANCTLLGASVRGKIHAHRGEWRDDSFRLSSGGDWVVAAVADGAGSARLSRIGSRIACECVGFVATRLASLDEQGVPDCGCPQFEKLSMLVGDLLQSAFVGVQSRLIDEARSRQCLVSDLATTLLIVALKHSKSGDRVFWLGVGDCAAFTFRNDRTFEILGEEDHGTTEGETRFITAPGIEAEFATRVGTAVFDPPLRGIALITDGVADDFFPLNRHAPTLLYGHPIGRGFVDAEGQPLNGILNAMSECTADASVVLDWLEYDKPGSFDDRTLVLLLNAD